MFRSNLKIAARSFSYWGRFWIAEKNIEVGKGRPVTSKVPNCVMEELAFIVNTLFLFSPSVTPVQQTLAPIVSYAFYICHNSISATRLEGHHDCLKLNLTWIAQFIHQRALHFQNMHKSVYIWISEFNSLPNMQ